MLNERPAPPEPSDPRRATDYRRRFYDRYRSTYVEKRDPGGTAEAHARRFPIWERLIARHLPASRDALILDCGCGEGYLVSWLVSRGYRRASGVDASAEEVAVAQSLGLPVEHGEMLPALAASRGSLDFIILRNVLEHFPKEEMIATLTAARQALRPGGVLWIQAPNAESPFGARLRYADFTHQLAFTQDSMQQVLRIAGFDSVEVGPVRAGFTGLRGLLWKCVEALYKLLLTAELGNGRYVVTQDLFAVARIR
jgi:2-polyprenyl-3-methyl-5-hydroxy-6-metoxy-1,4-benzoquinol methylase